MRGRCNIHPSYGAPVGYLTEEEQLPIGLKALVDKPLEEWAARVAVLIFDSAPRI